MVPKTRTTMIEHTLGKGGLRVSAVGLGCMGMSEFCDPAQSGDSLSAGELGQIDEAFPAGAAAGARSVPQSMQAVNL